MLFLGLLSLCTPTSTIASLTLKVGFPISITPLEKSLKDISDICLLDDSHKHYIFNVKRNNRHISESTHVCCLGPLFMKSKRKSVWLLRDIVWAALF